jgi:excisionase family DNA binding protein
MDFTTHTSNETHRGEHASSGAPAAITDLGGSLEPWVTKRQVCTYLGMSKRWVEEQMSRGMPAARFGNRPRFKLSAVEAWLLEGGARPC